MFNLTLLGSGSAGNCAVIESDQCRLLIDGGLSARQIAQRLELAGIHPVELDGILLTHEHGDHVNGLEVLCKKFAVPIYCNPLTGETMRSGSLAQQRQWNFFQTGNTFSIKDITIETFPVPHDAVDPVGFVLHHGAASLGFITDLGFATKLVFERLRQVHTLVIETNHDEKMLQDDVRRPWPVKQRIMSRHGHLSNDAAALVVEELLGHNLRRAVLCHLSRDCNSAELATQSVRSRCGVEPEIFCAAQSEISPRFALS
jgi:phosphoribosyl 1,2-cyclic phosphodiesterase